MVGSSILRPEESGNMKQIRCAIYTRKSTEEGLEQDFNSLHAQREACEAYVVSQKSEGWVALSGAYDDGGYSGGNMDRPALQALLKDIKARKLDIIVVYKIDRLTRSLADFAKLVEVFDKYGVTFVSVTQSFNTTTSMGRLTLNVLLSFAQFEREVTAERIRDKFAASKKKGIYMGGTVPLGYDVKDRKLVINPTEAETVRNIFQRYVELRNARTLKKELQANGIYSKARKNGSGNCVISRTNIYNILSNPVYIGLTKHKENLYPGQHKGIIDKKLWDQVQQQLLENTQNVKGVYQRSLPNPLKGKLFDEFGEKLILVRARRKGRQYSYCISKSLASNLKSETPDGWRLPAREIEKVVVHVAMQILQNKDTVVQAMLNAGMPSNYTASSLDMLSDIEINPRESLRYIRKAWIRKNSLRIELSPKLLIPEEILDALTSDPIITQEIPMVIKRCGVKLRLVTNFMPSRKDICLIKAVATGHKWFHELISGKVKSCQEIAIREKIDPGDVTRHMNLAFLAPKVVENILSGHQPAELTREGLLRRIHIPLDWAGQKKILGTIAATKN